MKEANGRILRLMGHFRSRLWFPPTMTQRAGPWPHPREFFQSSVRIHSHFRPSPGLVGRSQHESGQEMPVQLPLLRSGPNRSLAVSKLDVPLMASELQKTLEFVYKGRLRELDAYRKVPDELLQLRHVALSGDGEPTMAPEFAEAFQAVLHVRALAGFPFFKIVLITNAMGLDLPRCKPAFGI
jgi:hypothetical protein